MMKFTGNNTSTTGNAGLATGSCLKTLPELSVYWADLRENPVELVFAILALIVALSTACLFLTDVRSKHYRYTQGGKRLTTLTVLGIYPFTSFMACTAVVLPRATILADLLSSCYLSLCLYVFIRILVLYYGDTDYMVNKLQQKTFSPRSLPCCCCTSIPDVRISRRAINIMGLLVLQAVCVQPFLYFIQASLWANDNTVLSEQGPSSPSMYINILTGISILLAFNGLVFFIYASSTFLAKHKIKQKFGVLQFVLLFSSVQKAVFESIFTRLGILSCKGPWGTSVRASMIHHMVLVFEMLLLAVVARVVYRRSEHQMLLEDARENSVTTVASPATENDSVLDEITEMGTESFDDLAES